eukprot:CAMPEP_0182875778 /NCGR_PEP_ID=MMETSP0034_2-20130328/13746_1 /TAXON_ID=156128 /ORGANISM="Nephroselmis pyriformis, Strain CCMP717" /LENGTH=468 /DNA_ID=CAMNT_0025008533 /DNA_START=26 /DNA_END=1436 /DNA_ORIENTATION=+
MADIMADKGQVSVWSWGKSTDGETGRPSSDFIGKVTVSPMHRISCGWNHTVGVNERGHVYSWGSNEYGQLGRQADVEGQRTPMRVAGELAGESIAFVSCGHNCTAAVAEDGALYTWGQNTLSSLPRLFPLPHPISCVSCGGGHMAAVSRAGHLYTWGYNEKGQLGHGHTSEGQSKPRTIPLFGADDGGDSDAEAVERLVASVACGQDHTMALTESGEVYSWGDGRAGQLGHLTGVGEIRPRRVAALEGKKCSKVAAGAHHSAAVGEGGALWLWGCLGEGRLGLGKPPPSLGILFKSESDGGGLGPSSVQRVPALLLPQGVESVACGQAHTLVVSKGRVYGFGYNTYGQACGEGARTVWEPELCGQVVDSALDAAAGGGQSVVITAEGMLAQLCERALQEAVDVDSAVELCLVAERLHAPRLLAYAARYIRQNLGAVKGTAGWARLGAGGQKNLLELINARDAAAIDAG